MRRLFIATIFFTFLIVTWEILVRTETWSHILIPSPLEVGIYLVGALKDGTLIDASIVTIKRLLEGYAIGLLFGIPLGLLNAKFELFEDTLGVIALGFQTLPSICWAPLALIWFGQT